MKLSYKFQIINWWHYLGQRLVETELDEIDELDEFMKAKDPSLTVTKEQNGDNIVLRVKKQGWKWPLYLTFIPHCYHPKWYECIRISY